MIKKYTLEKYGITQYALSALQILSVQMQGDDLVVWVDDDNTYTEPRLWTFTSVFTGDNSPLNADYIGTVQDRSLVYHVYVS